MPDTQDTKPPEPGAASPLHPAATNRINNVDHLKDFLCTALDDIGGPSSFATGEPDAPLPNPGLSVDGIGPIGLPLSANDAKAIISKSKKSAFGKGTETRIDDNVRRSWELDPNQFTLRNPKWQQAIDKLIPQVCEKLAAHYACGGVKMDLYKLLLYEEGAFFKPHQDSEKAPGMFGTFIVSLPSQHEGGEISLKHQKETYSFKTEMNSEFGFSWAAWYSDVFHEILPVTQGYRLVLTYNMCTKKGRPSLVPPTSNNFSSQLQTMLHVWDFDVECTRVGLPRFLVHRFEHKYTQASLSLQNLKSRDHAVTKYLDDAVKSLNKSAGLSMTLYLANMEREVIEDEEDEWGYGGGGGPGSGEEVDSSMCLHSITSLDGKRSTDTTPMCIDEEHVLHEDELQDDLPDDEEHSGFTGNEGCTATYFYRNTVLVIVPTAATFDLAMRGPDKYAVALEQLQRLQNASLDDKGAQKQLKCLCWRLIEGESPIYGGYSFYSTSEDKAAQLKARIDVATLSLERGQFEMYDEVFALLRKDLPPECFYAIGKCLATHGKEKMEERIIDGLEVLEWVASRYEAFENIVSGFMENASSLPQETQEEYRHWFENTLMDSAVFGCSSLRKIDGSTLAASCTGFADVSRRERVESLVESASTPVKVGFCSRLAGLLQNFEEVDAEHLDAVLVNVLNNLWADFKLDHNDAYHHPGRHTCENQEGDYIIVAKDLAKVLTLTDQGMEKLSFSKQGISNKFRSACDTAGIWELKATLIYLIPLIVSKQVSFFLNQDETPTIAAAQTLWTIIHRYVSVYVQKAPPAPTDWRLPNTSRCTCADCGQVNTFMQSPTERVGSFRVNQPRRQHLSNMFPENATASYSVTTLRTPGTHTWQVTKNRKEHNAERRAWQTRRQEAKLRMKEADGRGKRMREFLGDRYHTVMDMDVDDILALPVEEAIPAGNTSACRSKRARSSVDASAANKRPATGDVPVVDLTDE